jgi:soluble lytic murein transglycosylase-like protein
VPAGLLHAIAQLESSGNPDAVGGSGEIGLMQFMPATAKALKVDPRDPEQSIRGAATLLRHLMQKYRGDIASVLAAYNEGETAFDRRRRRGQALPAITQRYVRNGLALLGRGGQSLAGAR